MEAIINSKLFIPTMIFLGSAVLSIIALFILSRKSSKTVVIRDVENTTNKTMSDVEKRIETEATAQEIPMEDYKQEVIKITPLEEQTNILPTVPVLPDSNTNVVIEDNHEIVEPIVEEKEVDLGPPPSIDIPIPTIDDSPITVEEIKSLVGEDMTEAIHVEETNTIDESNVNSSEIITAEEAKQLDEVDADPIKVETAKSVFNEQGESIKVEEVKQIVNDMGETAFKSIPTGDTSINTDIKVDPIPVDPNKTEIFDLNAIQNELQKREEAKRELL